MRLGRGGGGEVFLAWDRALRREVAIKRLISGADVNSALRFSREAALMARLKHRAIVPILDLEHSQENAYYVMPYIPGSRSLRGWLGSAANVRPIPRAIVLGVLEAVCEALDHIHAHGVVHRDVKPANILVAPGGETFLMDFGLAHEPDSLLTFDDECLGTLPYLSPEQVRGQAITPASDLYSLGLVLYAIATGTDAVKDHLEYIRRIANGERLVDPPSEREPSVGKGLEQVIMRAIAPDPQDRFPSGAALIEALAALSLRDWWNPRPATSGVRARATLPAASDSNSRAVTSSHAVLPASAR